jgi:histidinol-phosphate aminotransferase
MLKAREAVLSTPSYHPPLSGRVGLRLDFNENTDSCSPRVLRRLQRVGSQDLATYPEREPVEEITAAFLKVERNEVLLTNGVDEAIHLLCQTYLDRGDEALIVVPTYSMYAIYAKAAGGEVIRARAAEDFSFPLAAVMKAVTPRTRLIAIANPNNPTGSVVSNDEMLALAHVAPQAALLVDEAYFEFYGTTILERRREAANVFVARTFSKAYGMAGLRLGVLIGDEEQMRVVRRISSPYNVNALALACLPEALADQSYISEYVAEVLEGRIRLEHALKEREIQFWPSQANFVLLRVGQSRTDAALFAEQMRQRGILVRDRSADEGCEGCVRITIGRREHVGRLLQALDVVIPEIAIGQGASRP